MDGRRAGGGEADNRRGDKNGGGGSGSPFPGARGLFATGWAGFVASNERLVAGNGGLVAGNGWLVAGNDGLVAGNGRWVAGNGGLVAGKGRRIAGTGTGVAGNGSQVASTERRIAGMDSVFSGAAEWIADAGKRVANGAELVATLGPVAGGGTGWDYRGGGSRYSGGMQARTLGRSGLSVSPISLGCWIFGVDWWGHYTQADCDRLCSFSYERGVTYFDNGDAYGNGRAETLFGNWIKSSKIDRSKLQIGGKVGYDFYGDPGVPGSHSERKQDFSPAFVRRALEESLKRLQTDYIDLYMAHNIKLAQFRDDLWPTLEKLKDEGKIKSWGVSLGPAIGWREEGFEAMIQHGAQAVQTVFNLFEQHPGREFCEVAVSHKAGVLARVHDNSSVLKDVIRADTVIGRDDHRKFRDQNWKIFGAKKVELIRPIAQKYGYTIHELACKWLLQQPGMSSITGTFLKEAEIQEAINAANGPEISKEDLLWLHNEYERDFGLGEEAHACNLKSSTDASGAVKSGYVAPPVLIA